MRPRANPKRKSSVSTSNVNKKFRPDILGNAAHPQVFIPFTNSRAVVPAVIVPTLRETTSLLSKEQRILQEIKKKEKRVNENIKRIMLERRMKAEQSKKAREEKLARAFEKRLQIEKKREERKKKTKVKTAEIKIISKGCTKKPASKTRTQELIDQYTERNKFGASTSKQSPARCNMPKTPQCKKSLDYENYELTPQRNFNSLSDDQKDEDEKTPPKHIPFWAKSIVLKSALLTMFYHPIDTEELFGSVIDPPNLTEIFKPNIEKYNNRRNSSPIWNFSKNY